MEVLGLLGEVFVFFFGLVFMSSFYWSFVFGLDLFDWF